tara:strand:+ start:36 stop:1286 length:1251 start_codon:yes stop_codon:yes gene_type:complete
MDEQNKKINLFNFFGRSDSLDKLSSAAFSKSNPTMSAIGDNKLLIESLQSSIQSIQSQIQNIANYLIVQNKTDRVLEERKLFEERELKQKQEARDRALGLQSIKGDRGSQGPKGEFGQEGGGGSFLGGLIKALALGGTLIASVKLLGPVLLPMLTKGIFTKLVPALAKGIGVGFGKLAGVITKGLTGSLGKLPIVGKAITGLGGKLFGGIKAAGGTIAKFLLGALGIGAVGGAIGSSAKASESNMSFASSEDDKSDKKLVEDKNEVTEKRSYGNRILGSIDAMTGNFLDLDKKGGETFGGGRVFGGILDAVTGNKFDFDKKNSVQSDDLTFKDINQLKESVSTNTAAIQTIVNPSPQATKKTNSPVTVQNSKPQVTYTEIKTTKPAIPFINTLGNQYLSLSPHTNKLPPEIARLIQ